MVFDDVKKELQDRFTGPFFGPFLVSWAIWNWQIVILLVSGEKWSAKIAGSKEMAGWGECLLYPLFTSIALTLLGAVASSVVAYLLHRIYLIRDQWIAKSERLRGDRNAELPNKQAILCFQMVNELQQVIKSIDSTLGVRYADAEVSQREAVGASVSAFNFIENRILAQVGSHDDRRDLRNNASAWKAAVERVTPNINALREELLPVVDTLRKMDFAIRAIAATDSITVNKLQLNIPEAQKIAYWEWQKNVGKS